MTRQRRDMFEGLEPRVLMAVARFVTPIAGAPNRDWVVHSYVDLDPGAGVRDYRGGARSYDGHFGVDYVLANFAAMDRGVGVVAAAAGTVVAAHDGEFDRQTAWLTPEPPANYVTIDHGGGLRTRYLHLRQGSVAVKVGQAVAQGQSLGLVGSSGRSNVPHLHFETTLNGAVVDPFSPRANYWVKPPPYGGDVHGVLDHGVSNYSPYPTDPSDPRAGDVGERMSDVRTFKRGAGAEPHAWVQLHNLQVGDTLDFEWRRPGGALFSTSHFVADQPYVTGGWWASRPLGASAPTGTWQVVTRWNGVEVARDSFAVTENGAPEARLSTGPTYVLDGRTTPINFGVGPGPTRTFTLENHGSASLAVGGVTVPAGYVLTDAPAASIPPGQSDTFSVKFVGGAAAGRYAGNVVVRTNDADEARYNFAVGGRIGNVSTVVDAKRPTATLTAPTLTATGRSGYVFTVRYADNVGVVPATMGSNDLFVTGPNGYDSVATLVKVNRYKTGTPRTATYRIVSGGPAWVRADNGYYTVTMRPDTVTDASGNAVAAGVLGRFRVLIPKAAAPAVAPPPTPFATGAPRPPAPWADDAPDALLA